MVDKEQNTISVNLMILFSRFLLSSFSYQFLTFPVLTSVSFLLFAYIIFFGPGLQWLTSMSFVSAFLEKNGYLINGNTIMTIFLGISFALMILKNIIKKLLEQILKRKIEISFKTQLIISAIFIFLAHLSFLIAIPFAKNMNGGAFFVIICIVSCVISVGSFSIYKILNRLSLEIVNRINLVAKK